MNKLLLKSKMILFGDNNGLLAEYIGISKQRFSAKINETKGAEFTQGEIRKIKNRYNLSAEEIEEIFFKNKVS
ncbi:hypothetical protein [Paraclostridium sordellii]|uniref:Uncharacterized protein n=1 Tax=Paraclostridium sordellii TaxID=1505 RepID=A0A9P1P9E7_PARSO|nr:hypothetical protein [Paeniclostridium sordellii]CEO32944.1 Uncharacterised protein [[Clostridium] sordellii] [Paeniclostridium sordellii]